MSQMQPTALDAPKRSQDWGVAVVLIFVALSIVTGRIAVVLSPEGDTAFLSANDRSRWCTIASLVERGTYEIDAQTEIPNPVHRNRRPWGTIDKVRHRGADGAQHYYSSKPPLLPTMIAGIYWVVQQTTTMTLTDQPIYLGRVILFLVNIPLLALFYVCTVASIRLLVTDSWTRNIATGATCFGTMMMPFAVALNNHLPAAAATAFVLFVFVRNASKITGARWWFFGGIAAGFMAANELPALSMAGLWCGLLLLKERRALLPFLGGIVVVAAAFFGTNYLAHDTFIPPYAHRGNGHVIATVEGNEGGLPTPKTIQAELQKAGLTESSTGNSGTSSTEFEKTGDEDRTRFVIDNHRFFAILDLGDGNFEIRHWDDWYDYPTSYWMDGRRRGVDLGEPSRAVYAANMTIGYYGLFSLTPIWLITLLGFASNWDGAKRDYRLDVVAIAIATAVCTAFYLLRPEIDRNYGGVSVCFRWMLWFAPLWLFVAAAGFEKLSRFKWGRRFAIVLLAASVFSMSTSLSSPWQSPWLYRCWQFFGLLEP